METTINKPDNYAAFYGLLNRMHAPDKEELKKSIVLEYTAGRTDSLREMKTPEYRNALKGMQKSVVPTIEEQKQYILRQKRSAVLHRMQLLGIDTADWSRVDAYCKDKRIAGKPFRQLTISELSALLVKLRAIKRKSLI
jgi:hypothetical protein